MEINLRMLFLGFRLPGGNPPSLTLQTLHINFPVNGLICKALCLPQNSAVLRDQVLSPNTRSWVDSPLPAVAYTYPQMRRADCPLTSFLR